MSDTKWSDAINVAMSQTGKLGRTGAGFPKLSNLEATGLIMFARAINDHARSQGRPFAFDWYRYALPALGWRNAGDRFVMTKSNQDAAYALSSELWHELAAIAKQLDADAIPFWLPRDPRGDEKTYKALANWAWGEMQNAHPEDMKKPSPRKPQPTPTPTPGPVEEPDDVDAQGKKPKPKPKSDEDGGGGAWLLLGLALLIASDN